MTKDTLFGHLFGAVYDASGTTEPVERFFACMFAGYFNQSNRQPSCAAVRGILAGKNKVPRKLISCYRDSEHPRCPRKLEEDLSALLENCFWEASRCRTLNRALEFYLSIVPESDAMDLRLLIGSKDLLHEWTCLTWHAMCGDLYG